MFLVTTLIVYTCKANFSMVKALFENLLCLSYVSPMSVLLWFRISFKVILVQLVYRKILAICAFTSFMHLFGIASQDTTDINFNFLFQLVNIIWRSAFYEWTFCWANSIACKIPIPLPKRICVKCKHNGIDERTLEIED
jgi:hypothetical protein